MQEVKCIGLNYGVGAQHIEHRINEWIQEMFVKYRGFKVLAVNVVIGKSFTMATILYEYDHKE